METNKAVKAPRLARFYGWLKNWAENKQHKVLSQHHGCDQRCSFCQTWQSTVGGWAKVQTDVPRPYFDTLTCGKCGQDSEWFMGAMLPIPASQVTLSVEDAHVQSKS